MTKKCGTDEVYMKIKEMIEKGVFPPNGKLNQIQLAEELGVSRTPVATALHMLATEGYLDQKQNAGFFVHSVTLEEVLELLLARAALESIAVYSIAESGDDETLGRVSAIFQKLEVQKQSWDKESRINFLRADQQCHKALLDCCDNTWVRRINENIKILEHPNALGMLRDPDEIIEEHRKVQQAILKRDAFAAQEAMLKHILRTRSLVMEQQEIMKALM